MSDKIAKKRIEEKKVIDLMIDVYTKKHDDIDGQDLKDYASLKISKCPRMSEKSFCSTCKIHCYQKEYRENIRKVMRYSGPRMIFYHPILAIKHMLNTIKSKI